MNIIDIQDSLKDFSENQLIKEMQMPSGNAPQFLVLSEIQRRKRVRDDFSKRQAAAEPTVAEEALAASGVPVSGIAGMSEAMAPQSAASEGIGTIMPQAMRPQAPPAAPVPDDVAMGMRSGGLMSYGEELSSRMSDDKIDPFLDEVEQMADSRFGLSSGNEPTNSVEIGGPAKIHFDNNSYPRQHLGNPIMPHPVKGGPIGRIMPFAMKSNQFRGPVQRYDEGGVVKAQNGLPLGLRQRNPGNIRPGAGFIGESGDGGGYATFGSDDEGLRAIQRLLMTYGDKYDIKTLRQLANRYAPPSDNNPTDSYIDFLSDKTGIGADDEINLAESGSSIIPAIVGFEQGQQPYSQAQIDRAIRAAGTDDPAKVSEILGKPLSDDILNQRLDQEPDILSSLMGANAATNDAIDPQLIDSGRPSPAAVAAERLKKLRAMTADKESGNQTTGADMPAGELSELFPDAGFFATDQEENRIREEQLNKATTADPDFEVMPVVAEVKEDLANVGIGSTSAVNAAKAAKAAKAAEQPKPPEKNVDIRNTGDSDGAISLVDEIKALQAKMEKNRESDKWLALAQAGMALMSSKEPTLLGAAGEAGIAGLSAMREANQRYEEGVIDLINARAKIQGKKTNKMDLSASNVVSLINRLQEDIASGLVQGEALKKAQLEIIGLKRMLEIPEQTFGADQAAS
jgi:hypothetical protein